MRWQLGRRKKPVEDHRRRKAPSPAVMIRVGGLGVLLLAAVVLLGGDPTRILPRILPRSLQSESPTSPAAPRSLQEEELADFVSVVLADTADTWQTLFREMGGTYEEPALVLFSDAVESACGFAQAASGPFYCPADQTVYIDLSFYEELQDRYSASADLAQVYVIAHEVGHHVQNLLGIADEVQRIQQQVSASEANQLSLRLELQADCFAGVWAHHTQDTRQILEAGDVERSLTAVSAIGGDRQQEESPGYATPDTFTHGSSAQRLRWFTQGIEQGEVAQCNTFAAADL